jgi:hypothetical protein
MAPKKWLAHIKKNYFPHFMYGLKELACDIPLGFP